MCATIYIWKYLGDRKIRSDFHQLTDKKITKIRLHDPNFLNSHRSYTLSILHLLKNLITWFSKQIFSRIKQRSSRRSSVLRVPNFTLILCWTTARDRSGEFPIQSWWGSTASRRILKKGKLWENFTIRRVAQVDMAAGGTGDRGSADKADFGVKRFTRIARLYRVARESSLWCGFTRTGFLRER